MAKRSTSRPLVHIYELRDPIDGKTYYVGKSVHPRKRLREHLADVKANPNTAKARWVQSLLAQGAFPKLHIARTVRFDEWIRAEARAIREHHQKRSPLTNVVMPSGTRKPQPEVYIRSQDYWDDLSPEYMGIKRRMFPFKHPEGYGLTVLFNLDDRGWRYGYDLFPNTTYLFDNHSRPYKDGFPPGWRTLKELVASENWFEKAILDAVFKVRADMNAHNWNYEIMTPIELFEPEQLGYWPTEKFHSAR